MGKGKGKKGSKVEKTAARAAKRAAKAASIPKPVKPSKTEKAPRIKKPSQEKTSPAESNSIPTPADSAKLFMKSSQHAKWPSLFKKHLGLIEAHIKTLDRVMQGMKSEMTELSREEKLLWELGELGNWRVVCGMMDRAREVLATTREIAKGVLPPDALRHKKGLGVVGTTFEPLEPKLAERAAATAFDQKAASREIEANGSSSSEDSDGDTEMSDSASDSNSDTSSESESESDPEPDSGTGKGFVPSPVKSKKRKADAPEGEVKAKKVTKEQVVVEENPYFVVDLNPTPVNLNGGHVTKKAKTDKKDKLSAKTDKKTKVTAKKSSTEGEAEAPSNQQAQVDFAAIQAQLQAEVEEGLKKQAEREVEDESKKSKKEKKKRKRESIGGEGVVEVKKARAEEDKADAEAK